MTTMLHRIPADQSPVGEPERRGAERSETPRSGGSPTSERPGAPDPEVPARPVRRHFTTAYKLEILRTADACQRPGEVGALLRREGLYSSHLVTWRRQRAHGLTPKTRGRPSDPQLKKVAREKAALETANRQLERRLQRAEAIIAFQKKLPSCWGSPPEAGIVTSAVHRIDKADGPSQRWLTCQPARCGRRLRRGASLKRPPPKRHHTGYARA